MLKKTLQQLESVARRSRQMLLVQRLSQGLAALVLGLLVLGALDWLLRLPGVLRLLVNLVWLPLFGYWLWARLRRVAAFKPTLEQLALRAERIYPDLRGSLASAVSFALQPAGAMSASTATLAHASLAATDAKVQGRNFARLLNPAPTRVSLLGLLVATVLVAGVSLTAPDWSQTALKRWVLPLGDTAWPKRVQLVWEEGSSLGTPQAPAAVAADTALGVSVRVTRGQHDGLRVRLTMREEGKPDKTVLMQPVGAAQAAQRGAGATYRLVLEPMSDAALDTDRVVTFVVRAGDAELPPRAVRFVPPPRVQQSVAQVSPPAYAADLLSVQEHTAQRSDALRFSALAGSTARIDVRFNKPVVAERTGFRGTEMIVHQVDTPDTLSGRLAGDQGLAEDKVLSVFAEDAEGLVLRDAPRYRLTVETDRLPEVAIDPLPVASVLPTALLPLKAVAQDDVGLAELRLEAHRIESDPGDRRALDPSFVPAASDDALIVPKLEARRPELVIEHGFALASLDVSPGDTVWVVARARDVYESAGETHPEQTALRRLVVIDEAAFSESLQRLLTGVNDRVEPIAAAQNRAQQQDVEASRATQQQVSAGLEAAERTLQEIQERVAINRFEDQATQERLNTAASYLERAQDASQQAQALLPTDENAARQAQAETVASLNDLMELLSDGQSTAMIQSRLRQLQQRQQALAERTQRAQAQTAGLSQDQLSPAQQQELSAIAAEQSQLSAQAQQLTEQIEDTAAQLEDNAERAQQQAAAEALQEAGETARAGALSETMRSAAESAEGNQLADAQQDQASAMETLEQMLEQVQGVQAKRQAILESKMRELEKVLAALVRDQTQALDNLAARRTEADLSPLLPEQRVVRQDTMIARRDAASEQETEGLTEWIVAAIDEQASALRALTNDQAMPADAAERGALAALTKALEELQRQQQASEAADAAEQRAQIVEAYTQLAERQRAVLEAVQAIAPDGQASRRQRPRLMQQAALEQTVLEETEVLRENVQDTVVFERLHQRIADTGARAQQALARGQADRGVTTDLKRVQTTLQRLAEALAQDEDDSPFDEAPQASQGGSSAGGESGSQDEPGAIPPLAELRLLRALQADVLEETRFVFEEATGMDGQRLAQEQADLVQQQAEILEMGQALNQRLQEQSQQQ